MRFIHNPKTKQQLALLSLGICCALFTSASQAQSYKCLKAQKVSYQQYPCEPDSTAVQPAESVLSNKGSTKTNLWTNLKQGMSLAEVRQKVPEAKPGDNASLSSGARGLLRIENVAIAGTNFTAQFYFSADKFIRVNLSGSMSETNENNIKTFEKILEIFKPIYGTELSRELNNEKIGLSGNAEWKIDAGKVWISILPITDTTSMLNLGYVPDAQ